MRAHGDQISKTKERLTPTLESWALH
jgi:hypothetical protein